MRYKGPSKKTELRGHESENNVNNALYTLKFRKKIIGYKRTERNGIDDQSGIDFYVYLIDSTGTKQIMIPLQVKSSHRSMWKHYSESGNKIRCIVGRGDPEQIVFHLAKVLGVASR